MDIVEARQWAVERLLDRVPQRELQQQAESLAAFLFEGTSTKTPQLYDVEIDAFRNVTQTDVDLMLFHLSRDRAEQPKAEHVPPVINGQPREQYGDYCIRAAKESPSYWLRVAGGDTAMHIRFEPATDGWVVRTIVRGKWAAKHVATEAELRKIMESR